MKLEPKAHVYFLGIGGTGMAAVAGLLQEAGYRVTGSDAGVYPPMSTMLEELGIAVKTPYAEANLQGQTPAMVVVANVLSRGNVELEAMLTRGIPYTSFPKILGDLVLAERTTTVVAGTHGKTTTSSLLAHVLNELGEDPGFVIGGIPRNFPRSFRLGGGKLFVVEGDEYDTAFFDKGPKFLHYRPKHLILNNLEYDHADIYPNVEAIEAQFARLAQLVQDRKKIVANVDDPGIQRVLAQLAIEHDVTRVATLGEARDAAVRVGAYRATLTPEGDPLWHATITSDVYGTLEIETMLSGRHNLANIAQVIALIGTLEKAGELRQPVTPKRMIAAIRSFKNVARRLDRLASANGIDVYEDFAHHPTAVKLVIEGFREIYPSKRLVIAFEPRSATQRRNVFQADYAKTLALADRVYIGECPVDKRIAEENRMDTAALERAIGAKAKAFPTNAALLSQLKDDLAPGDAVIFMSSGSFSGAQYELAKELSGR
jgi:UDP-N-acetylmuramate: L-alanyl-gamma-D-glutamyl-meso-diaminopimelate ligase